MGTRACRQSLLSDLNAPKLLDVFVPNTLTVRPLNKKQVQADAVASAYIKKEWQRLRDRKVWDETIVRDWSEVAVEACRIRVAGYLAMLVVFGLGEKPSSTCG